MSNSPSAERLLTRRKFLSAGAAGAASLTLSACVSSSGNAPVVEGRVPEPTVTTSSSMYAAVSDAGYDIPAVPFEKINPRYYRQEVADPTGERAGTIVVDTANHFLYLVRGNGRALRYGVGLGRAGFEWAGRAEIRFKQQWPRWFPPSEMIDRQPELEKYRAEYDKANDTWLGGMQPGVANPLGARALYIFQDGKDTLYRVHGSPEWWTIGKSVSSGCVRMINQDVIDLYNRVPDGSPILVTSGIATA
ncbi:L,D-transpeptidase [Nitratireductor sp. ZSWI3]|uniref:L,D-transpeptidase n=1 Tax=Nitratireductor sp. ZSWI3 TaxID=2966359 RepID=UPI00214F9A7C|nr:L,D-transpeptidase [Nitratireductor sp. ZSWI3]MCR4265311.1 L,D-transpeptidase [Nitratireductor sp. ZSWI3]